MERHIRRILIGCTAAGLVLACGHDQPTPEDRNQIEFRINNLAIQRGQKWVFTCRSLVEDYGEMAVPYLIDGLGSTDAQIRRGCAYSLGHIGHRDAIDPLGRSLGDPDFFVRLEAAASLCKFKIYDGVPLLILALRHEKSPLIRGAAYQTLAGSFGHEFQFVFDPQGSPEAREAAIQQFEAWWSANRSRFVD